jgi:thiol-disulfide isomerase/thioredoxin
MERPEQPPFLSRRSLLIATPIALLAALLVVLVLGDGDDQGAVDTGGSSPALSLEPGEPAGEASEVTLTAGDDGDDLTTLAAVLDGRPTVVNFFGSWCAPCVKEMPAFQAVFDDVGGQVAFVGLAVNDRPEDAAEIVARTGVAYPTYGDRRGDALAFLGGGTTMPATAFVAADGTVIKLENGELSEDELRAAIDDLYGIET